MIANQATTTEKTLMTLEVSIPFFPKWDIMSGLDIPYNIV